MSILVAPEKPSYTTKTHLIHIRNYPHVLGHIAGKKLLTDLHSNWIRYIWDTTESRALQGHRGSYKTTAILVIGTIWWLLFHPDDRIAIIRKKFTDAAEIVTTIRYIMQMPEIIDIFVAAHGTSPKMKVKRYGMLTFSFKKTATPEGSVNAYGLDYGMTGAHFDRIVLDDFVTLRDKVSKAEREKTKEIVREVATNIIDPGKPVAYVGTPWHRKDAWSIPTIPEPVKYDVYSTGLLSESDILEKKKKTTSVLYTANYELKHIGDENALFQDPVYGRWTFKAKEPAIAQLDAAYDGFDLCALTIMQKINERQIQAVGFVFTGNVKKWFDFIKEKYDYYRVNKVWVEDNADKGYTADKLEEKGMIVGRYHEKQNKHIKISTNLHEYWRDIIWDKDTEDEYIEPIVDYMEGSEPDDPPDSASSLIRNEYGTGVNSGLWDFS